MFKYDEFPEIKKMHEISVKKNDLTYKKEFKFYKFNTKKSREEWKKSIEDEGDFDESIYAETIYNFFKEIKPQLTYLKTGEKFEWDKIFEQKKFEELDSKQRKIAFMMVEYERPYILPAEYYDERDRMEEKLKGTY